MDQLAQLPRFQGSPAAPEVLQIEFVLNVVSSMDCIFIVPFSFDGALQVAGRSFVGCKRVDDLELTTAAPEIVMSKLIVSPIIRTLVLALKPCARKFAGGVLVWQPI